MSASKPSSAVLDHDAECAQYLYLLDSSHDPRLFVYPPKAMLDRCQVSSFLVWYRQQMVERIATQKPDVYCQLSSRWRNPLCFLHETR